jgi:hypothetical protein
MATRKGARMVDPSKINDADSWIKYYNARYANLGIRKTDGAYLVYHTEKEKSSEVAKVINIRRGYDAIVLANYGTTKELRDSAAEKLKTIQTTNIGSFDELSKEYKTIETELLETIDEHKLIEEDDKISKAKLVRKIGKLQKELAEVDEKRYSSLYPIRMVIDKSIPFKYLEYETKSDTNTQVSILTSVGSKLVDRIIEIKRE